MKKLLPAVVLFILAASIFQLGLLMNVEVIHGHYLTLIGVLSGLAVGVLYLVFRGWLSQRSSNVLHYPPKQAWHQRPPDHLQTFFFSILFGVLGVSLLNNVPDTGVRRVESYEVKSLDRFWTRYRFIGYLQLGNESGTLSYRPEEGQSFTLGQQVEVTIQKGLLGFSLVRHVLPKGNAKHSGTTEH
ncbi:hypothetical protein [Hydrogenophaga luteola]|uniref:NfeD-like C-terminal domain-containing protein n=1 Tax=Hydrogenophaga luteola TaxID=1591122 RepID=A0ABV7W0J7_9BURK